MNDEVNQPAIIQDQKIAWERLVAPYRPDPAKLQNHFEKLIAAYNEPGRYYHTATHIWHVLETCEKLKAHANHFSAVQFAAWFHDVVYDTRARDNEEKSASYANRAMHDMGIHPRTTMITCILILKTKN